MKNLYASDKIFIKDSKIAKGERGVFAARNIKRDELIEECPIIEIEKEDPSNIKEGILITYFFYVGEKKERVAVALGFGSIYNHTYSPNATYKIKIREKIMDFIAIRDIKKDEEITVNYNSGNPQDKTPLWF